MDKHSFNDNKSKSLYLQIYILSRFLDEAQGPNGFVEVKFACSWSNN